MDMNNHSLLDQIYTKPVLTAEDVPAPENKTNNKIISYVVFALIIGFVTGYFFAVNKPVKVEGLVKPVINPLVNKTSEEDPC
jgi:hypothetical protein